MHVCLVCIFICTYERIHIYIVCKYACKCHIENKTTGPTTDQKTDMMVQMEVTLLTTKILAFYANTFITQRKDKIEIEIVKYRKCGQR